MLSSAHLVPLVLAALLLRCGPWADDRVDEHGDEGESVASESESSESESRESESSESESSESESSESESSESETTGDWGEDSRLVGIAWHVAQQEEHVLNLDPFTGELAFVGALPDQYNVYAQGISAYDPLTRQMFQKSLNLLVIDSDSGTLSNVLIAGSLVGVDSAGEGRLLGIADGHVVEIDASMGTITSLAALPEQFDAFAQGGVVFDPTTDQLYVQAAPQSLLVVDASTGALAFSTQLQLGDFTSCGNLQVNAAGELIGLAGTADARVHVARVDLPVGTVHSLTELPPQYSAYYQGQSAIDRSRDRMIQLLPTNAVLVIDASDGSLISGTQIELGPYVNFSNVEVVF
jgi:hypothetical protein